MGTFRSYNGYIAVSYEMLLLFEISHGNATTAKTGGMAYIADKCRQGISDPVGSLDRSERILQSFRHEMTHAFRIPCRQTIVL